MSDLLQIISQDIWRTILAELSFPNTFSAELSCKFFRKILLQDKNRRKNQYILQEGFDTLDHDQILDDLEQPNHFLYYVENNGGWVINKVKDLKEGLNQFTEAAFLWESLEIQESDDELSEDEETKKGDKEDQIRGKCSIPHCPDLSTKYAELCRTHLEEQCDKDQLFQMRMFIEYGPDITKWEQRNMDKMDFEEYLEEEEEVDELPFNLKHVIFAYETVGEAGTIVSALCLGEKIQRKRKKRRKGSN